MKLCFRLFFISIAALGLVAAAPTPLELMRGQSAPGMQLVVVDGGRVVTDGAYGVRNLDTQQPVDVRTRFEIGSITKQFTAAAILQLRERGLLSLNDRLGKYVPQYREGRNVTLMQLLRQVSGVPNYTEVPGFHKIIGMRGTTVVITRSGTFDDIVAMLRGKPLNFQPGTKFQYSNSNYVLLGHVVSVVSGMPWERYIRTHIFEPAGMRDSSFMDDEGSIADMATGYLRYKGAVRPTSGGFHGWARGAGAIVSTATDLARWDIALFGGKIINRRDLALMTQPGPLPAFGPGVHYAFGWAVDRYDGQPRLWHNGGTLGFISSNEIYLRQHEFIIALINTTMGDADNIANDEFGALHPALAASAAVPAAGEDPAVTARAKAILAQFLSGNLDRSQLDASMNAAMTPQVVSGAKAQFAALGVATTWVYRGKRSANGTTTYAWRVTFSGGSTLTVYMSVDSAGKISGYLLSPQ